MNPGIYNITNEEYHTSPGISRSGINKLVESPFHYWNAYLNPDRPPKKIEKDMRIGEIVHKLMIEPDKLDESAEKKDELELAKAMANSAKNNKEIMDLIEGGQFEKSFYWIDEDTGILCKSRPDIFHSSVILDIKTTKSAAPKKFRWSIDDYGYHIQAAMALDATKALTGVEHDNFFFIVIEKKWPYASVPYPLDPSKIEQGRQIYKEKLHLLKQCLEKNEWPSYPATYIG